MLLVLCSDLLIFFLNSTNVSLRTVFNITNNIILWWEKQTKIQISFLKNHEIFFETLKNVLEPTENDNFSKQTKKN